MDKNKLISMGFALAGCCFIAATADHAMNASGSPILSAILAVASLAGAVVCYKKEEKKKK